MDFDVVPAERMKLVAVSVVYMRSVAECLVHIGNILLVSAHLVLLYLAEEFVHWSLSLCLACVGLSDGHSDQQLLIIIFPLWK
jgi:hypothetical protein